MKIDLSKVSKKLTYLVLFLVGLAIFSRSYELIYILFILLSVKHFSGKIDLNALLLFILGVSFTIFGVLNGMSSIMTIMLKGMLYLVMYMVGCYIAADYNKTYSEDKSDLRFFNCLFYFSLGNWIRFVSDIALSWSTVTNYHRWITDIWTGTETTATICAGWCVPLACIFYYALRNESVTKFKKTVLIIEVAVAVFFNILSGTRTFLMLLLVGVFFAYLYDAFRLSKFSKGVMRITGILAVIVLCVVVVYAANIGGLRDSVMSSTLIRRLTVGELSDSALDGNNRVERIIYMFQNFDKVIWGGSYCENSGNRIHNWVFQVLDEYGLITAVILLTGIVSLIVQIYHVIRESYSVKMKLLYSSCVVVLIMYGLFEPVATSNNIVISILFMGWGFIRYSAAIEGSEGLYKYEQ